MKWAIKHNETGQLFSQFNECTGEMIFDSSDPYVYAREVDALFVIHVTGEYKNCSVQQIEEN